MLDCLLIAFLLFFSCADIVHGLPTVPTITAPRKGRIRMALPGGGNLIAGSRARIELHNDGVGINLCRGSLRIEVGERYRQDLHVKLDRGVARPHENTVFAVVHSRKRNMRALFVMKGAVTVSDGSTSKLIPARHKAAWFKTRLVKRSFGAKTPKQWWAQGAVEADELKVTIATECVDESVEANGHNRKSSQDRETTLERLNSAIKTVAAVSARAEERKKKEAQRAARERTKRAKHRSGKKEELPSSSIHLAWALPLSIGTLGMFFVYGSVVRERVSDALNSLLSSAGVFGVCSVCEGASISETLFSMSLNIDKEQRHRRLAPVLPPKLKKQLLKDIDAEAAARKLLGDYECVIEVCHNRCTQCGHAETLLQAGHRVIADLGAVVSRSASGDLTMSYNKTEESKKKQGELVARWDTLAQESLASLSRLDDYNLAIDETNPGLTNTQIEKMSAKRAGEISLRTAVAAGVASQKKERTERLEDFASGLDLSMLPVGAVA
mgnify:CR=1 FL=1